MSETIEATKESREIAWCCGACEAAGHIEPGHFACSMPEIPAGWAITTDCGYTDGGWRAIIEPVDPYDYTPAPKPDVNVDLAALVEDYRKALDAHARSQDAGSRKAVEKAERAVAMCAIRSRGNAATRYDKSWLAVEEARDAKNALAAKIAAVKARMKADLEAANERVVALDEILYNTPIDHRNDMNVDQVCLHIWAP